MKRIISASVAIAALLGVAGQAAAADMARQQMPVKAPAYVAPYYNWTGFYAGVNGGGGWGNSTWSRQLRRASALGRRGRRHARLQLAEGQTVVGIETDLAWSGIDGSGTLRRGLPNPEQLVRHRARPSRLRLGPCDALRHRRSRLRQRSKPTPPRRSTMPPPTGCRLDRRRGVEFALARRLDGEGRVSPPRSRQLHLHDLHRRQQPTSTSMPILFAVV